MATLLQKNMLIIEENHGKFRLCLIVAPHILLSTKEYDFGQNLGFILEALPLL